MKYTLLIACLMALAGCDKGVDSPKGFSLPEGNAEQGKAVFLKYKCLHVTPLQALKIAA